MSIAHSLSFTTAPPQKQRHQKQKPKTKILNILEKRFQGFFGKQ
jgi:hypothetical protein